MSIELGSPHIEKAAGGVARLRRFPRIRVAQLVMDYLAHGWSVDEMCRQHPYLTPAEGHAAMAYYFDHKAEIEQQIEADLHEYEAARRKPEAVRVAQRLKLRRNA